MSGSFWGSHEGFQVLFRTSGRNMGLPLRRCSGQGPHLAKTLEPRVFSGVAAGFSSDDGDYRLPPLMALGSPVFHLIGEGNLGVALESLQGQRHLIQACGQDLIFLSREDRDLRVEFQTHPGDRPPLEGKQRTPLSSQVSTRISWNPLSGLKGVKPPLQFGERTRDCSPGQAGKEGPQLARTGASHGFPQAAAPMGVFS